MIMPWEQHPLRVAQGEMERLRLTDDCELRPLTEADAEELHALVEKNRAYLADWMPWAAEQTFQGTRQFLAGSERRLREGSGFELGLVRDGRIVGAVGLAAVDGVAHSAIVGYWLDEEHQGSGLMTRAVRALVEHAFGEMGLHRVEIRAAATNERSRAIPERLGFRPEGVLREAERVGDRHQDLVVYGRLASDQ
jgi:ribosomal-protein-serine acetyltransferase